MPSAGALHPKPLQSSNWRLNRRTTLFHIRAKIQLIICLIARFGPSALFRRATDFRSFESKLFTADHATGAHDLDWNINRLCRNSGNVRFFSHD